MYYTLEANAKRDKLSLQPRFKGRDRVADGDE